MRRLIGCSMLVVLAPASLYLVLALIGGTFAVNRAFAPTPVARGGVALYLRTNGVHADLVLPVRWPDEGSGRAQHDWSNEFPLAQIVAPAMAARGPWRWIAFGWGDRGFYLQTPRWRDLRASTAWIALTGQGSGAVHVEYIDVPERFAVRRIEIDPAQYQRLVGFVRAWMRRDADGALQRIDHPGYGLTDAFYEATGRYTPWLTSNQWVRDALAHAGVRTAAWAPFDAALYWHLPGGAPRRDGTATIAVPAARQGRAAKETR